MKCSCIYRGEGEIVTCEGCSLRARLVALEVENAALRTSLTRFAEEVSRGLEPAILELKATLERLHARSRGRSRARPRR